VSEAIRAEGRAFARFLESLPEEERIRGNEIEHQRAQAEHKEFQDDFRVGNCYLCHSSLASFDRRNPCVHWLLNPLGFKKDALPEIARDYGFFQIQSYLRWVANEQNFAQNINNLPEEGTGSKIFELTIKYKNLEWSFSCAGSDFEGHGGSEYTSHPHYHMQMRINNLPFIKYRDYHLPLSEMDIINIEAMRQLPQIYRQGFSFGEGMNEVLSQDTVEFIVNNMISDDDYDNAPFNIQTLLVADEGAPIRGDQLNAIIQEAKARKVPITSLVHKLPNVSTKIIVSPGPGVVAQAPRSRGKRR